jgi:tetratricopeptide (TPR) repeat protein
MTADVLIKAGRLDEAEEATHKAIELSSESMFTRGPMILIFFFRGQFNEALDLTRSFFEGTPYNAFGLTVTYHAMGRLDESDAAMLRLSNSSGEDIPHLLAMAHAMRGETDQAFEWLDKADKTHNFRIGEIKFDPFLRNLHDDPRWDILLDRLEVPQ